MMSITIFYLLSCWVALFCLGYFCVSLWKRHRAAASVPASVPAWSEEYLALAVGWEQLGQPDLAAMHRELAVWLAVAEDKLAAPLPAPLSASQLLGGPVTPAEPVVGPQSPSALPSAATERPAENPCSDLLVLRDQHLSAKQLRMWEKKLAQAILAPRPLLGTPPQPLYEYPPRLSESCVECEDMGRIPIYPDGYIPCKCGIVPEGQWF